MENQKVFSLTIIFLCTFVLFGAVSVSAQTVIPLVPTDATTGALEIINATASATASEEAQASISGKVQEKIQEKTETDITETTGLVKSRLALLLDEHPIEGLTVTNVIQYLIRQAVNSGVPANMLVLMLMFPVVVSLIAVSRHLIGLEGFGVYGPAVLAVAFVSTGLVTGIFLFLVITGVALFGRSGFRQLKLQYLPRTALLVWFVSLVIFFLLVMSPFFVGLVNMAAVGIFPILVLILLSENFVGSQISLGSSRLLELMFETILLSGTAAWIMGTSQVQDIVILHPEMTIVLVAMLDLAVGKYTGLRVSEFFRFKPYISVFGKD